MTLDRGAEAGLAARAVFEAKRKRRLRQLRFDYGGGDRLRG
jgi:hypothetical protein